MKLSWGTSTDIGNVRKSNQDQLFANGTIFVVADGMGGANGGGVASQIAIDTFVSTLEKQSKDSFSPQNLIDAVDSANLAVYRAGTADAKLRGMGTTLVSVVISPAQSSQQVMLLNVGDSRCYLYRAGDLTQLTQDHSWVAEMFRAGMLSTEEIATSKSRHVLTRVLGVESTVEVDMWHLDVCDGDILLLCSDGLTNELSDEEMGAILGSETSPQVISDALISAALNRVGSDNATALVIDFTDPSLPNRDTTSHGAINSQSLVKVKPLVTPIGVAKAAPIGPNLQSIPVPIAKGEFQKAGKIVRTVRVASFLTLLVLIIGIGIFAIRKYLGSSYFVGIDSGNHVAIYQGRPGGLLWFAPHLVASESLIATALPASYVPELKRGVQEPNLSAANTYVRNLRSEVAQFQTSSTGVGTAIPTTTSTTATTTSSPVVVSGAGG